MPKTIAGIAYILGTLLMAFGFVRGMLQAEFLHPEQLAVGIAGIFVSALVLFALTAVRLWRTRRAPQILMLLVVGSQALICLHVIAYEFRMSGI